VILLTACILSYMSWNKFDKLVVQYISDLENDSSNDKHTVVYNKHRNYFAKHCENER